MARTEITGAQIKDYSVDLTKDVTGILPVANGGTGSDFLALGNVLLGNGTGALQAVAPGPSGNVLVSNGTSWVSSSTVGTGDVTLGGTQTLTNKTLTSPRINQILDTTGAVALAISATTGGNNYLEVCNAIDNWVGFRAWGANATVPIYFFPKGTGQVTVYSPTGTSSLTADGTDNQVLNLVSKGTGAVQANGVPVVTTTGTQSLSNKTLTNPAISGATITGTVTADMLASGTRSTYFEALGTSDGVRPVLASASHVGTGPALFVPSVNNALSYLTVRGGTVTATKNGAAATLLAPETMFEPNGSIAELSGGVATNDVVVIEVDLTTMIGPAYSLSYGHIVGIDSRVGQSARNVTIELWNSVSSSWESFASVTNNTSGHFARYVGLSADARTKIRYTLTNFVTTTLRVHSLFVASGNVGWFDSGLLPRSGGSLYGTTAAPPTLTAQGANTNIDLSLAGKGTGGVRISTIKDTSGNVAATFVGASGAVNYIQLYGNTSGGAAQVSSQGSDSSVQLNVTAKGSSAVVLRNGNGVSLSAQSSVGSPVNYIQVSGVASGSSPYFVAAGSDTNISLSLIPKGTGFVGLRNSSSNLAFAAYAPASAVNYVQADGAVSGSAAAVRAYGSDTNVSLNLTSQGTGTVQANGVDIVTTTGTQTLTNKTISGASNTLSGIPQSAVTSLTTDLAAKVATSSVGAANGVASLDTNGKVPGSQLPNSIMTYEGLHNVSTNSPALTDAGGDAGQVYRISVAGSRDYGSGSITLAVGDYLIHNGTVWEKADTTDAVASVNGYTGNVSLTKSDVGLGNVDNTSDATKNSATATLTNKTLTTPKITTSLLDTNGATMLGFSPGASANNYLSISNAADAWVGLSAVGAGTNIPLFLQPKGNGAAVIYVSTGQTPTLRAEGQDTNHNLNLTSKGTGTVQANGVPVVTTTGTQSLSNKTLTSPTITGSVANTPFAPGITLPNSAKVIGSGTGAVIDPCVSAVSPSILAHYANDLAFADLMGGSITYTLNGSAASMYGGSTGTEVLRPNSAQSRVGMAATTDVLVIEVTVGAARTTPLRYGTSVGISMSASPYCARNVKIETYDSVTTTWTTQYDVADVTSSSSHLAHNITAGANEITKIRFTLTNKADGSPDIRISQIFVVNYLSELGSGQFLARNGGTLWGTNAAPPAITAGGGDTNIDLSLAGKGTGGVRMSTIKDTNGSNMVEFSTRPSAVNYLNIANNATGSSPEINAVGSDTNLNVVVTPKGTGSLRVIGGRITPGSNDVNLNLSTLGTGVVQANGVPVVTTTGTQSLSNKTLVSPTLDGGTTSLNQASSAGNATLDIKENGTAKAYLQYRGTTAGVYPNTVRLQSQTGTNADLMIGANAGSHIFVAGGQNGLTAGYVGISNAAPACALDVTGEIRASTAGSNSASVVTVGGTQTLTNKTITSPKISAIADSSGNTAISTLARASAVNYVVIANSATGAAPEIGATGVDSQVGLNLGMRGTTKSVNIMDGQSNEIAQFYSAGASAVNQVKVTSATTGNAPRIGVDGDDANIGLDLRSVGTGAVQANGVPVATTTGVQTLTNKTISGSSNTFSAIPQSAVTSLTTDLGNKADVVVYNSGDMLTPGTANKATFLNLNPESTTPTFLPNFVNDLAFLTSRGGSYSVTVNGSPGSFVLDNAFLPDSSFASKTIAATTDVVVITVTFPISQRYGTYAGIVFPHGWGFKDVTIEFQRDGVWTQFYSVTNNTDPVHFGGVPGTATTITGLRYTLTNTFQPVGQTTRISSLFCYDYASKLLGTGYLMRDGGAVYGTTATPFALTATGGDANIGINLVPKGTGAVQANGVDVVTTTGTQSLSNKTISGASNTVTNLPASATPDAARLVCTTQAGGTTTENGANTWAKIATVSHGGSGNTDSTLLLGVVDGNSGTSESAILSVFFRTATSTVSASITYLAKGGATTHLQADSFKIISNGFGTDFELWVKKVGTYGHLYFYELSRRVQSPWAVTYSSSSAWQSALPTGSAVNVLSDGVTAFGVQVADISSAQTLTNKTLTSPKIDSIKDTNGNTNIQIGAVANAVNYLQVNNSATGGSINLYSLGSDTNIDLNLLPKGTGQAYISSVPIVTTTGTQTLTNKRITPRIVYTASSATPAINVDTTDQFNITALAVGISSMSTNLTGTPVDGQKLLIRIKDNGNARTISWGSSFTGSGTTALLTTTAVNKTHLIGFIYDSTAAKWVCVASDAAGY